MAYRGTEAYDFSLFEPQIIEQPKIEQRPNVNPQRKGAPNKRQAPVRRSQPAKKQSAKTKTITETVSSYQFTIDRKAKTEAIPDMLKYAIGFLAVCFALIVALLALHSQSDTLLNEISSVQNQIKIEQGENVRLNAELSSKIATDKIESYAEDVLGMVKAENYQINYIDLSNGDEILVSGDKSVGDKSELSSKIKALFAYIF